MEAWFAHRVQSEKPLLVEFYATWCGPCMAMMPVLDALQTALGEAVDVHKIDIDRNIDLAVQQKVMGVPTFALYKHGKEVWRQAGTLTLVQLLEAVHKHG